MLAHVLFILKLKKPDKIRRFDNLAIVSRGAAPSNEVDSGESEELDVEELQACFDDGPEFEAGELETFTEEIQDNINYKQYLYDSPEAAEGAAQGLDCEGYHKHDIDGGTWYMPCENHDEFLANVKAKSEELQLSEARNPEYDGTEESSWGDVSKDLTAWADALGYDDVETVSDLTESQKQEVANHTLLGDPESDTWQSLSYFPVVNPNTGSLNRGALEAVRSGRGQAADIPQSTYESAYEVAGSLLNENWDTDVEEEMSEHSEMSEYSSEEMRIASQMSSYSEATKTQCLRVIDLMNPERKTDVYSFMDVLSKVMREQEMEKMYEEMKKVNGDGMEEDEDSGESPLNKIFN